MLYNEIKETLKAMRSKKRDMSKMTAATPSKGAIDLDSSFVSVVDENAAGNVAEEVIASAQKKMKTPSKKA